MADIAEVLSGDQLDKVQEELNQDIVSLRCDKIFEDDPSLQLIGTGYDRCTFATNQVNNVLKIARSRDGIKANKRASNVMLLDDELAEKTFAKPVDIDESGVAMLQEEVELMEDMDFEEVQGKIDKPESLKDNFFSESQVKSAARGNMQDKLDKVADNSRLRCNDIVDENLGIKNRHGVVLADLGECKHVDAGNKNDYIYQGEVAN